MAALNTERDTKQFDTYPDPRLIAMPMAANVKIWQGSIVCDNNAGYATKGAASTTLLAAGRAEETVDNLGGAAGEKLIKVRRGVFRFANSAGGDEITIADRFGVCYIVDDQTVGKTSGGDTRSRAGIVFDVDASGVWVLMGAATQAEVATLEAGKLRKVELQITHEALTAAATSQTFNVGAELPANARIIGTDIPVATPISGGSISTAVVNVGYASDPDALVAAANVFAATDGQAASRPLGIAPNKNAGGKQITAQVVCSHNVNTATAGDLTVTVLYMVLA